MEASARVGMFANMAKMTAADVALKTCDHAIETLGGYGFSEEYGVIYLWDAVRLLKTAPITREMILNYVAEHVLGLPRSY
jgi:acyl-CoA dehydrogenase